MYRRCVHHFWSGGSGLVNENNFDQSLKTKNKIESKTGAMIKSWIKILFYRWLEAAPFVKGVKFEFEQGHSPRVGMKSLPSFGVLRDLLRTCTSVATRRCTLRVRRSKRSISRSSSSCRSPSSFTSPSDSTGFCYQNSKKNITLYY